MAKSKKEVVFTPYKTPAHRIKGSKEAKQHMAKIRAIRGKKKTTKVGKVKVKKEAKSRILSEKQKAALRARRLAIVTGKHKVNPALSKRAKAIAKKLGAAGLKKRATLAAKTRKSYQPKINARISRGMKLAWKQGRHPGRKGHGSKGRKTTTKVGKVSKTSGRKFAKHQVKGSKAAKQHMAKVRAARK